jgi:hypothetical protein
MLVVNDKTFEVKDLTTFRGAGVTSDMHGVSALHSIDVC